MKIIKQSAEIMPVLPHLEQIAEAGKVCYQVDEVTGGPEAFVERIIKKEHRSVLEMAVVTVGIVFAKSTNFGMLFSAISSRYINVTIVEDGSAFATSSLRGWMEWIEYNSDVYPEFTNPIADLIGEKVTGGKLIKEFNQRLSLKESSYRELTPLSLDFLLEHASPGNLNKHLHIMVKLITNRAVSHEIVRHRPCSFLQESQRYCRYSDGRFGNEISFICPSIFWKEDSPEYAMWERHCASSEQLYLKLLKDGSSPQAARTVLPNSTKTEMIIYANLEQWKHIFKLRAENKEAEPSMRGIMIPLQGQFKEKGWL
jgi:thymidylate synthase (FAD)